MSALHFRRRADILGGPTSGEARLTNRHILGEDKPKRDEREFRTGYFPRPTSGFICTTGGRQEKIGDLVKVPQSNKNEISIKV